MRIWKKIIYVTLSSCLVFVPLQAQELNAKHTHFSTEDGLPSNAISDIEQDPLGYVWISTWSGLCRFDGFNFRKYTTGQMSGIPFLHNRILDIYPDREGNIWMRMYDDRVFVLNRHTDCIQSAFQGIKGGEDFRSLRKLTVAEDGYVYANIKGKGIYQMKLHEGILTQRHYNTEKYDIRYILADDNHGIWLNAHEGLLRMDSRTGKVVQVNGFKGNIVDTFNKYGKAILIGLKSGDIFTVSEQNLNFARKITRITLGTNNSFTSIHADNTGLIWYTTNNPGVSYYDAKTGKRREFQQNVPAPESDVHGATLFECGQHLWIRMNHGGFGYYDRRNDCINYFHNDPANSWNLSNTVPTYIALPEGVLFLSTIRRGLEKLELLNQRITKQYIVPGSTEFGVNETRALFWDQADKQLLIGNKKGEVYAQGHLLFSTKGRIYNIAQDHTGLLWICDKDNGLFTYQLKNKKLTKITAIKNNAYQTLEDKNGIIWVAIYGNGVAALKNGKLIKINGLKPDIYNKVRTLCMAPDGKIWVGTTDGILIISKQGKQFAAKPLRQNKQPKYQLAANDIIQLCCDKKGTMWIATNGGGLSQTISTDSTGQKLSDDGSYSFKTFGEKDGLPSDEIRSITFDKRGNVWFSSDQNICSYDPQKGFFTTFSVQDGVGDVACSEAGAITLPNGRMLFGTLNGYYIVDIAKLGDLNGNEFRLAITDFYINDQLMSPRLNKIYNYYVPDSNTVKLPSRSSVFAFSFASLNYQLQHRVHYQYMLEGFDKVWKNADQTRTVSYSDVPAGTYRFRVKAFLLEKPDKYEEKVVTVVVPPYILLSAGALWTYLFLVLFGGFAYWKWYKNYMKKKTERMRVLKVGPQEIAFQEKDDYDFVKARLDWLELNYSNSKLKIDDMVRESKLSRTSFYNQLKALTGLGPKEFISDFRLKKALMYLENGDNTVAEVAYKVGFNDPVYFARAFKQKTGVTPSQYRENALNGVTNDSSTVPMEQQKNSINENKENKQQPEQL